MKHKCIKCGEEENLHYNYDFTKDERPITEILCGECGDFFNVNVNNNGNKTEISKKEIEDRVIVEAADIMGFYDSTENNKGNYTTRAFVAGARWMEEMLKKTN
jgi:transcription elongation factor Elf1